MLCPYLRGHWTFGGYFFTKRGLLHRPFNIWCQLGQKCLFTGSASIEVGWPQLLWILNLWQKSAVHAKFGHYRTSGSWVMSSVLQKTSNARSPFNKTCKNHWSKYFYSRIFQFRSWDPSHEHMVGVCPLCSPLIDGWRHPGAVGDNCHTQANNRILVLEKPSVAMSRTRKM